MLLQLVKSSVKSEQKNKNAPSGLKKKTYFLLHSVYDIFYRYVTILLGLLDRNTQNNVRKKSENQSSDDKNYKKKKKIELRKK